MVGSDRNYQIVVVDATTILKVHPPLSHVHRRHAAHQDVGVLVLAKDRTDRISDVAGAQGSCGHLVEHGLEQVVIGAINDGHMHRSTLEGAGGVESAEAAAQDDDVSHGSSSSRRQRAKRITSSIGGTAASSAYAVYM